MMRLLASNRALLAAAVLCICLHAVVSAQSDTPVNATGSGSDALKATLLEDLEFLRSNVLSCWQRYGLDKEYGGVHGTLDWAGAPVEPTAKTLIQQARHVWAFSTHYLMGSNTSAAANSTGALGLPSLEQLNSSMQAPQGEPSSPEQLAKSTFDFMVQHMQGANTSLWVWGVSRNGSSITQRNKVITGQWFVIYAFSQYYKAFGDPTAKALASRTFTDFDDAWHTPLYGGYIETPINTYPSSTPPQDNSTDPSTLGLVVPVSNSTSPVEAGSGQRSVEVLMHGVEALTALHNITNDTLVLQRLQELVDIICNRLERSDGLLASAYTPAQANRTWQKVPGGAVKYGTNLEIAWLVSNALDHLLTFNAIDLVSHNQCIATMLAQAAAAVRDGYDQQYGGFYEQRSASGDVSRVKVWWVQAEGMMALWKLHKYFGSGTGPAAAGNVTAGQERGRVAGGVLVTLFGNDTRMDSPGMSGRGRLPGPGGGARRGNGNSPAYLAMLADTARFIRQHQTDNDIAGEQFWQVEPNGTFVLTGDVDKDTKGNRWKASYHSSRAPLYLLNWIKTEQQA